MLRDMEETMAQTELHSERPLALTLVSLHEDAAGTDMLARVLSAAEPAPDTVVAASLQTALETGAGGQGLVLGVAAMPERMLARALGRGDLPSQALADWQAWAEDRLTLLRRARARVLLLCEDTLMSAPGALTRPLAERLGCGFSDMPDPAPAPEDPRAALHEILARHLLKSSPRLRALAEELGASIVGGDLHLPSGPERLDQAFAALSALSEPEPEPEPDAALGDTCRHLRASIVELQRQLADETMARALLQADREGLETRLAATAEDASLREAALGAELLQLGRDADAQRAEAQALRAQIDTLRADAAASRAQLASADDTLAALRGDLDERTARLRALELDLAAADEARRRQAGLTDDQQKDIDEQDRALAALQAELDAARAELDHIHRSRSWQLAGAIRSVRHGFRK